MSAAEQSAPTMLESLSWTEIRSRHPGEWVCLVEVQHEPDGAIRSARLIGHHADRSRMRSSNAHGAPISWSPVLTRAGANCGLHASR
jgi:hypothetical protein